jgi:inhibitor of the pro-sigma K processing machinery
MENAALNIFLFVLGLLLTLFIAKILAKPLKLLLKLLISSLLGGIALIILNSFSHIIGISIAVNGFTAVVCGVLGLPGLALLIALKMFL